jgi:chromosome segregation protein
MRLKRVKLFGFKTFAERTEFDIDGDLTAVVGSNGCGKSNLVDAILWALGEGSPKHLRAETGTDVIFNGSAYRKPVGFAEVTLIFDNEDAALPIDTIDVSVTRKLNRSGESEYRINRTVCRQRDIIELFADTGLGRTGYSIVGQKEIDSALSASPEDRRAWVDEAAGVQRYRARKVEAQRRLAAARTHLERTADILRELDSQREPLREEAEVAERYNVVLGSLREVEVAILTAELSKAVAQINESSARLDSSVAMTTAETARADRLDVEINRLTEELASLDSKIERLRAEHQTESSAVERSSFEARMAEQRLASLDELETSLGSETASSDAELQASSLEVSNCQAEWDAERAVLEQANAVSAVAGSATVQLNRDLEICQAELEVAKRAEAKRQRIALEAAHRSERITMTEREIRGIASGENDGVEAVRVTEADEVTALAGLESAKQTLAGLLAELSASQSEDDKGASEMRRLLAERASLDGRIRGIEATIASHEGLSHGSRAVLDAVASNQLQGDFVPVGEAVSVKPELAIAIETALGGSVNDLIVDSDREAKQAVEWLKANRGGRATFQPISLMRPQELRPELRRMLNERGVVGRAADLVESAPRFNPVVEALLGRVLIAETLDDALRIARDRDRPYSRIVTLDGEVVRAEGSVTGGAGERGGYGLVQRKAELTSLKRQATGIERQCAAAQALTDQRAIRREAIHIDINGVRTHVREAEELWEDARRLARAMREELQTAGRSRAKLERELEQLNAVSDLPDDPAGDPSAIEQRRHAILKQLATQAADQDSIEGRLQEAQTRVGKAQSRLLGAQRRLVHIESTRTAHSRRMADVGPERDKMRAEVDRATKENARATAAAQQLMGQVAQSSEAKRTLLAKSLELSDESRAVRETLQALIDASHQAELVRTRAEGKRATALERLLTEYEMSEPEALASAPTTELAPGSIGVVERLRRELRAMGPVNIGAIDAYSRVSRRWEELEAQQADILGGIAEAEAAIGELDKLTRDRFEGAFEKVRGHFAHLVTRLFGGGEGSIELTLPNSIIESGIDIFVTLPGKRRQHLALLSGGERSLCALSFLFALLEVKSSPLVVLDEVDAPLDGLNVERFALLLHDYAQRSQFLIVTHNKATIAAMPAWLGVTMQEPGVSSLVWFREASVAAEATA